jgi:hypothetical protein
MIKLGLTPQTLRTYSLNNPLEHRRATANPFAPGISNQGAFSALDGWAEWTAEDFSSGVGHITPDEGVWDAQALTTFNTYATLPPRPVALKTGAPSDWTFDSVDMIQSGAPFWVIPLAGYSLPASGTFTFTFEMRLAYAILPFSVHCCTFAGTFPSGINFTSTPVETSVETYTESDITNRWGTFTFTFSNIATPINWLCIHLNPGIDSVNVNLRLGNWTATTYKVSWDGTTVITTATNKSPIFETSLGGIADYGYQFRRPLAIFNNKVYRVAQYSGGTAALFVEDFASPNGWSKVGDLPANSFAIVPWGNTLYIAQHTGNARQMNTSEVISDAGFVGRIMHAHRGYLWRADANRVIHYTSDVGSGWTTVDAVNPSAPVGMAGLGNRLYISTPEALFCVDEGDFISFVMHFDTPSYGGSGRGLVAVGDALYVISNTQTVYRIDSGHQIQNILRDNDLFVEKGWTPNWLTVLQDYLCVIVNRPTTYDSAAIYLYRNGAWHFFAKVPSNNLNNVIWDKRNNKVVVIDAMGQSWFFALESMSIAPKNQASFKYEQNGIIEFGKFYGGRLTMKKEWHSVFLSLTLCTDTNATLYFTTDDSVSSPNPTQWVSRPLPFTPSTYDPPHDIITEIILPPISSNWIRIAVQLEQNAASNDVSPILNAIAIRYLPMVTDRWQWNLVIPVQDKMPLEDGSLSVYSVAQQRAHLESLIKSETLVYFQDLDGRTYGCKVLSATNSPTQYDPNSTTSLATYKASYPEMYQITLQQFEEYIAP